MKKFCINILDSLNIWYNHYLSTEFIEKERYSYYFKRRYPLDHHSRWFDKPAIKWRDGTCYWYLDDKRHRVEKPAIILPDGSVEYWENGERVK